MPIKKSADVKVTGKVGLLIKYINKHQPKNKFMRNLEG
jgi:hypothetical protein